MKIIQRHYIYEFLKMLGILSLGLALIFSLLDLIDKIDDFMSGKPSIVNLFFYTALNLPKYLYYLLPISLLICSLFIFSQASRNKELVTVKAAGGRLKGLFYPFIIIGILLSLFGFIIGEFVVPDFSWRSHELKNALSKKDENLTYRDGTLWMRGTDGSPIKIELYIPERKYARGVSIFIFGEDFLKKRIEAEVAEWIVHQGKKSVWKLKKVIIYDIESGEISSAAEMDYPYLESPDFFSKGIKKTEEMGISELYRFTKRLKAAGFKDTKLIVDLNSKGSYPLTNFFMMLLGIALSVRGRVGSGLFAAGLGLFISFIYWLGYTMILSMGYAGIIPPIVAPWVVPILFGTAATYLFRKIPE